MSISANNSLVFHGGGVVFHWHNGVACDEWMDKLGYRVAVNAHKSHTKDRLVADEVFHTLEEAYDYIDAQDALYEEVKNDILAAEWQ